MVLGKKVDEFGTVIHSEIYELPVIGIIYLHVANFVVNFQQYCHPECFLIGDSWIIAVNIIGWAIGLKVRENVSFLGKFD